MRAFMALAICLSLGFYAVAGFSESDEICCTWVNTAYKTGEPPQKIMFHYDGTYAAYADNNSIDALSRGMFQITEKRVDSDGSVWYKIRMHDPLKGERYQLARITDGGKKLEFVCQPDGYPTEIDADGSGYCNYLRSAMDYKTLP